jgi:hypothetical protein
LSDAARLRVFISSPGDVAAAREVVAQTIEQVGAEYQRFFSVEPYLWENEAMLASGHFQDSIDPPSKFDIVILVLGARLGTFLPVQTALREYRGIDGRSPVTGTEWEFEDALDAARKHGAPDLLVYRSKQDVKISSVDLHVQEQQLKQLEALNTFWSRHFADRGAFIGAYGEFDSLERLAASVERDLQTLIKRRIERLGARSPDLSAPLWAKPPFRGLASYEFEQAPIFFGRNESIGKAMLQLLDRQEQQQAFLLVLGASGSGKSSLVKAGVAPRLFEPRRFPGACFLRRVIFQPGETGEQEDIFTALARRLTARGAGGDVGLPELLGPSMTYASLADHLRDAHASCAYVFQRCLDDLAVRARTQGRMLDYQQAKLLLIVDQLEELFTSERFSPDDRSRFIALLGGLARSGCVMVIATMRRDVWHLAAETAELVGLAEGPGRLELAAPSPAEIGLMIRMPARAAGLAFEVHSDTGVPLDDRIAEEAANQPGALPLLSYLLETLADEDRDKPRLSYETFERLGRLKGAIASRADETLNAQPPEVRAALPQVLFALVQLSGDQGAIERPIANRSPLSAFAPGSTERRLVQALADARLVILDTGEDGQASVRVAHEALITQWATARDYVVRNAEALNTRRMVEERLRRFRALDAAAQPRQRRLSGIPGLLSGLDLSEARGLIAAYRAGLSRELSRYIEQSIADDRRVRRATAGLIAATLGLIVLLGAGGIAASILAGGYFRSAQVQQIDRQLLANERAAMTAYGAGDLQTALAGFTADQGLAQRMIALDGASPQWRYNLAVSYAYAAFTLEKTGNLSAARDLYDKASAAAADVAQRDGSDPAVRANRQKLQSTLASFPINTSAKTR